MSGRKQDCVWVYFDKIKVVGKAGCQATCKTCGKEIQGLVARMKQHYDSCTDAHIFDTSTTHTAPAVIHVPGQVKCAASSMSLPLAKVQKDHAVTLDNFVMQTSASEKAAINIQIAHFICATNSPLPNTQNLSNSCQCIARVTVLLITNVSVTNFSMKSMNQCSQNVRIDLKIRMSWWC